MLPLKIAEGVRYYVRNVTDEAIGCDILVRRDYETLEPPPPNEAFIDIGCYTGVYSCMVTAKFNGYVLSIDPIYDNIVMTKQNLLLNNVSESRFALFQNAVGRGEQVTIVDPWNHMGAEISELAPPHRHGETHIVKVVDLAFMLANIKTRFQKEKVFCLKIDCEGGEYGFFESATLQDLAKIKYIVGEWHHGVWETIDPKLVAAEFQHYKGPWEQIALFRYKNNNW